MTVRNCLAATAAALFMGTLCMGTLCPGAFGMEAPAGEPDYGAPVPVADLRADFAALYSGLQSAHYDLYVHRPKAEYDALYETMMAGLDAPMSLFEAQILFQKFTAYGNVAHARVDLPASVYGTYRAAGGRAFPLYPRFDGNRVFVGEDYSGTQGIASGDEILAIDGEPVAAWLARLGAYISADSDYIEHSLMEFQLPLLLWFELGPVEAFEVTLRDGERTRSLLVPARSRAEVEAAALDQPSAVLPGGERDARMIGDVAYLRPGPFYNVTDMAHVWDNSGFVAFLDAAFESFMEADARALLIDLRDNPGGDNSFSDPMVAWFADRPFRFAAEFRVKSSPEAEAANMARIEADPAAAEGVSGTYARLYEETPHGAVFTLDIPAVAPRPGRRFEGTVYLLVNRHSYSNAVTVAAMVQDYGFGNILGEKTSDLATTYGAMETFTLPATGIEVGFPKAHIIRPSGALDADGVTPDIAIATPLVPGPQDAVLDRALQIIRQ